MRRVLASVLCGLAASSLTPVLADALTNQAPNPIFIAMPSPASMPTIMDNNEAATKSTEQITEEPVKAKKESIKKVKVKQAKAKQPMALAQATSSDGDAKTAPAQPTGSFPKTGIGGQFQKIGRFGKSLPKRLPPTLVCAVGGTPIAFVRHTISATQEGVKDIVGDSKFPLFVAPAICVSFPYGLCAGVLAGPVAGLANGWKYSDDKPYSKDAFSLGSDK